MPWMYNVSPFRSLISPSNVLQFQCASLTHCCQAYPQYFISFDTTEKVIFQNVSNYSLQIYRNGIYICILILYPETLLNSLNNCNNFCNSTGSYTQVTMHSVTRDSLLFLFNLDGFFNYILLDYTGQNLQGNVEYNGESWRSCLVPGVRWKAFFLSQISWQLQGFLFPCLLCTYSTLH